MDMLSAAHILSICNSNSAQLAHRSASLREWSAWSSWLLRSLAVPWASWSWFDNAKSWVVCTECMVLKCQYIWTPYSRLLAITSSLVTHLLVFRTFEHWLTIRSILVAIFPQSSWSFGLRVSKYITIHTYRLLTLSLGCWLHPFRYII